MPWEKDGDSHEDLRLPKDICASVSVPVITLPCSCHHSGCFICCMELHPAVSCQVIEMLWMSPPSLILTVVAPWWCWEGWFFEVIRLRAPTLLVNQGCCCRADFAAKTSSTSLAFSYFLFSLCHVMPSVIMQQGGACHIRAYWYWMSQPPELWEKSFCFINYRVCGYSVIAE